ncbi:MAG TPA: glycosyltransferase, partial [Gemmatimonadales bacterium]|nr:glycosyltransferase [Gemmatimonadales bacterium]
MHIALFFWDRLPVPEYGGTQRMVVALARGLAAAGHRVTLVAGHGSSVPEATLVPVSIVEARKPTFDIRLLLPRGLDIVLACAPLRIPPDVPWIRRLAGNWKPGTTGAPNTLYLSRNHAQRHGGAAFVYNGVDPADYRFRRHKDDYDLFLGRLHGVKGYRWAAAGAKRLR